MSQIDELISKLQEVSNHPQKTVLNYKKQGKGLVGMMPYYAPEEIVYAAGYLPVGMFGSQNPQISAARTYLPPFACSLMQADMELQLNGTYDCLDAVIFSVPCDTLRCMSQKWHGKAPVIVFTQPQNRKIRPAVDFLKAEYEHVRTELERILNVKISDLAIQEAIKVYNENRQVMREFCDVAAQYPQIFTPVKRHDVIKARWFMDKAEHTALVRELIDAVKKEPVQPWNGKKVILSGIMAEPDEFLDIFDFSGEPKVRQGFQHSLVIPFSGGCPIVQNAHHAGVGFGADRPPESLPEFHLHIRDNDSPDIVLQGGILLPFRFTQWIGNRKGQPHNNKR